MPRQCCFLCASDEGILLDITRDNKQIYHEQLETCSLIKIPALPTKLCHKCVYELNQCSNFIQRFKRITRLKSKNVKPCCSLCHHTVRSEFIFDLSKDHSLQHNSFDKVQTIFNYDLKSFKAIHKFICLSCRYTLDVLLDLKNVSKETATKIHDIINEKIDYVNMPKIKTNVVSRKTTTTESARINLPIEKLTLEKSDNDSTGDGHSKVMRSRTRNNKLNNNQSNEKLKLRICDKCQSSVKSGDDMYKIHKTKSTICRKCWMNMGLDKDETENQIQQNGTETKVCKVFLKDVLKDTELKEQKRQTVNKKQVVTEKSIENESKSNRIVDDTKNGESKQGQKRSISNVEDESNHANDEVSQAKKSKVTVQSEPDDSKESEELKLQTRKAKISTRVAHQHCDSDSSLVKRRSERSLTKQKQATGSSLSDADIETKRNRKKLRSILEGNAVIRNLDLSDESSSNDDSAKRKRRHTSTSPVSISKKSKTISTKEPKSPVTKQSKASQESQSSESESNDVLFDTKIYICDECGASYENRLLGLTHKLTHYKCPKLKLEKVKGDAIKHIPDTSAKTDEQSKDQSEIAIRVDDDEEESVNDTNNVTESTEDKIQDSKKDTMEDAIDMELVMKESDDDITDKRTEESQREEEEEVDTVLTDSLKESETETKKQKRSSYDNNNKCNNNDVYESEEKESIDSKSKKNTSLSNVEETQEQEEEDKQNALLSDSEDVAEEKNQNGEQQNPEESESNVNDNNEEENEDTSEKVTRIERKDSSEEEAISLEIWEPEPETTESLNDSELQKNSKTDVVKDKTESSNDDKAKSSKDDKRRSAEKKDKETVIDVESSEQESSECVEITESGVDDLEQIVELNKTTTIKSTITKEIIVTKESITIEEDDIEIESESISKSTLSKREESNDCADAAAEVLREVIDLASAEVQKRQEVTELDNEDNSNEVETLENISREIQNSAEVPSLN